jgi:SPP1 gp7 family putative phage head morphogenesis protein
MYTQKTTDCANDTQNDRVYSTRKDSLNQPYRVVKTGRVLTLQEESAAWTKKATDITAIANRGFVYFQVVSNQDACEECHEHNGAIYPVAGAKEGETLPPFHPNCKCDVRGFSTKNPNDDPWHSEILLWLEIMYGDGTWEEKARKLLGFYRWTEFSIKIIAGILRSIDNIEHVGKRMEEFFRLLDMVKAGDWEPSDEDVVFRLPGVHFEGKTSPLLALEVALPSEWVNYAYILCGMLDIDFYLVLAFILHESGGNPMAFNSDSQASGLMQIMPYLHPHYQEGGQYYDNYNDEIAFAEQNGADINNLFDPLGNITVGMMLLNEHRKLCRDPDDMRELVGRQGEGYNSASTTEILYYRDQLAMQAGLEPWYSDEYYAALMKM